MQRNSLNEKLLAVCQSNDSNIIDIDQVRSLLAEGADANSKHACELFPMASTEGPRLFPLLHVIAGKDNSVQVAEALIEYGARIDATDTGIKNTPLLTAIALEDEKLAEFFISEAVRQSDLVTLSCADLGFECQNTPLVLALKKDMDNIASMLVVNGADPNVKCRNGQTALHWACILRKTEIIKTLLEHDIDTQCLNDYGYTPYDYYVYEIKLLDIANPYVKGLCKPIQANMREFSDLYHHVDNADDLALQDRIKKRNQIPVAEIISQIIMRIEPNMGLSLIDRHNAIVNDQLESNEKYAKQFSDAIMYLDARGKSTVKALINIVDECHEIREREFHKNAALVLAIKNRDKEKISLCLHDKKLINAPDPDGLTALHLACMRRDHALINQLIERGADPTIKTNSGRTAIDYYLYQIKAADFKRFVSDKLYTTLCDLLASGEEEMPEFNEAFNNDNIRLLGTFRRNSQPTDIAIFDIAIQKKEESKAFIEGATFGALNRSDFFKNIPYEISTQISRFFDRRTGGYLAQTCHVAETAAKEKEEEKKQLMKRG